MPFLSRPGAAFLFGFGDRIFVWFTKAQFRHFA
jgi:hypothetical protein